MHTLQAYGVLWRDQFKVQILEALLQRDRVSARQQQLHVSRKGWIVGNPPLLLLTLQMPWFCVKPKIFLG